MARPARRTSRGTVAAVTAPAPPPSPARLPRLPPPPCASPWFRLRGEPNPIFQEAEASVKIGVQDGRVYESAGYRDREIVAHPRELKAELIVTASGARALHRLPVAQPVRDRRTPCAVAPRPSLTPPSRDEERRGRPRPMSAARPRRRFREGSEPTRAAHGSPRRRDRSVDPDRRD